ncbi:MAG: GDP-L-fucose synthase [Deltaproteobacteria bacterium]|nr:GDP-L-fucose synthase [Deltaproteobacteria bacterium]
MEKNAKIYIAGHRGLVGSAIVRELEAGGFDNLVFRTSKELDLTDSSAVNKFFEDEKPDYVFLAAARVGGIKANDTYPADFIRINLQIETNVIHAAYEHDVQKLLFLGSSCIYPKFAPQPMKEEHLLTGPLEPTNDPYAIAKIAGITMCKAYHRQHGSNFIAAMPTNLYGPGDNFDLETSHALPALIRKLHDAKTRDDKVVELWGTGSPMREFLYVDDLARALVFMMDRFDAPGGSMADEIWAYYLNVGTGKDCTIKELAETIASVVGFNGLVKWNTSMPDGTPRKLLDVTRINDLGWKASTSLEQGIRKTYEWFKATGGKKARR